METLRRRGTKSGRVALTISRIGYTTSPGSFRNYWDVVKVRRVTLTFIKSIYPIPIQAHDISADHSPRIEWGDLLESFVGISLQQGFIYSTVEPPYKDRFQL